MSCKFGFESAWSSQLLSVVSSDDTVVMLLDMLDKPLSTTLGYAMLSKSLGNDGVDEAFCKMLLIEPVDSTVDKTFVLGVGGGALDKPLDLELVKGLAGMLLMSSCFALQNGA